LTKYVFLKELVQPATRVFATNIDLKLGMSWRWEMLCWIEVELGSKNERAKTSVAAQPQVFQTDGCEDVFS